MIDHLRRMAIFARVVDKGSFRLAAKELNLAPSRISQTVSDLEAHLGVTLLYRSTRRLSLTDEGQILYAKVTEMMTAAESGVEAMNLRSNKPFGELRVTVPAFLTQTELLDTFVEFMEIYPRINLKLNFTDRTSDLINGGFDIAIRAGSVIDEEILAQKVGGTNRLLVASCELAASRPNAKHPRDLEEWDWIGFEMRSDKAHLQSQDGEHFSIEGQQSITVDSAEALYAFAIRGKGLTPLPEYIARRGIERGELTHILPEWTLAPLMFHAIWPDSARRKSVSLLFADFLSAKTDYWK